MFTQKTFAASKIGINIHEPRNKKNFQNTFDNVNCKSEYVIYLIVCALCNKHYVRKVETTLNQRLKSY